MKHTKAILAASDPNRPYARMTTPELLAERSRLEMNYGDVLGNYNAIVRELMARGIGT